MRKQDVKYLWDMAFNTAALFASWTRTKADDMLIMAIRSDEMFEEFWGLLQKKGFVDSGVAKATKEQLARLTFTPAVKDIA